MKKHARNVALVLAIGGMVVAYGENAATVPPTQAAKPTAVAARRRPVRPSGGVLERTMAIQSRQISVVNEQGMVPSGRVAELVWESRRFSRMPLRLNAQDAAATIKLVDDGGMTETMAIYPESSKAVVNVRALAADGAEADVLATRLRKEIIRAALFVVGAGYSPSDCLARPVSDLKELDALDSRTLSAETIIHLNVMRLLGLHEVAFCSYRQACREGWAPAPTNDVQKAIWAEFKADKERGPTNPITIQPPKAK